MTRAKFWTAIAALLAMVLFGCQKQVPSSAYWRGKPPDTNVTLPALPALAPLPPGTADQRATALAKAVVAGGGDALGSILQALATSGIGVRAPDGHLLVRPKAPGQGIVVDQATALALGLLAANDVSTPLSDVSSALTAKLDALNGAALGQDILEGLKARAQGPDEQPRFFARFIAGLLSQRNADRVDLLAASDPSQVVLDGPALELVLLRLAADLNAIATRRGPTASEQPELALDGRTEPIRLLAAGGPCRLTETEGQFMDGAANATTIGFDKVTEYVNEEMSKKVQVTGIDRYKSVTSSVNAILAVVKLVAYIAAVQVDIQIQPGAPLVRTKTHDPGAKAVLVAKAKVNASDYLQMLNCFRMMLNVAGMDVGVPQSGSLAGVQTIWECKLGCVADASGALSQSPAIVEFTRTSAGEADTGDTVHQKTDESGTARIGIEGVPQRTPLPDNAVPKQKEAEVQARIQLKAPSMSQDLLDASGGFSPGFATIVSEIVETLLRTNLLKVKSFRFGVTDWVADYKVDYTRPDGSHVAGVKCGGPGGEWDLGVDGSGSAVPGYSERFSGSVNVKLDATNPNSAVGGAAAVVDETVTLRDASVTAKETDSGTAHLDASSGMLVMTMSETSLSGGAAGPFGSQGTVAGSLGSFKGTQSIPVTVGDFCSTGQ